MEMTVYGKEGVQRHPMMSFRSIPSGGGRHKTVSGTPVAPCLSGRGDTSILRCRGGALVDSRFPCQSNIKYKYLLINLILLKQILIKKIGLVRVDPSVWTGRTSGKYPFPSCLHSKFQQQLAIYIPSKFLKPN
jgi:hypothetical protein